MLFSLFWLIWPLLYATGAMGVGTVAATNEAAIVHAVSMVGGCLLPLRGVWYIFLARRNNTRLRPKMLIQTVLEVILAFIIVFLPRSSYSAFLVFLGVYFSFHLVVQAINAVIYLKNRVFQYFIPSICQSLLFLQLIIGIILLPNDIRYQFIIGGSGYLLSVLGHAYLCDWLSALIKNKRAAEIFRKISVTMPGFSGLGIPFRLIRTLKNDKTHIDHDAEIIFSYSEHGKGLAGHCELCVDGLTYTYGNYDPDSRYILNTMGNGIIFRADKEKYIDFLVESGKTVVVYGLKLNPKQRDYFRHTLSLLDASLVSWQKEAENTPSDEYIHLVLKKLGADVYRIDEGRFKTYFLPTINCVTFTGSLLRGTAAGNIVIPGVYTPGSYMDALHRLYVAGNDIVVSVTTYGS